PRPAGEGRGRRRRLRRRCCWWVGCCVVRGQLGPPVGSGGGEKREVRGRGKKEERGEDGVGGGTATVATVRTGATSWSRPIALSMGPEPLGRRIPVASGPVRRRTAPPYGRNPYRRDAQPAPIWRGLCGTSCRSADQTLFSGHSAVV